MPRDVTHIFLPTPPPRGTLSSREAEDDAKHLAPPFARCHFAHIQRKKKRAGKKIAPGKSGGVYPSRHHFVRHHRLLWSKVQRVAPFFSYARNGVSRNISLSTSVPREGAEREGKKQQQFSRKKRSVNNGPSFSLRHSKPQWVRSTATHAVFFKRPPPRGAWDLLECVWWFAVCGRE